MFHLFLHQHLLLAMPELTHALQPPPDYMDIMPPCVSIEASTDVYGKSYCLRA
jgi:hypothetical protein